MREAREAAQGTLRQTCKTPSLAIANAAECPRKVRCQAHPAEDWQFKWAPVQTSPRILGEICPHGQILAPAPFLFWTVHGPFSLFGATEKRKWGVHCPAIAMAEIHPARQGEQNPPRPKGGTPPSRPRGAASPAHWAVIDRKKAQPWQNSPP